MTKKEYPYFYI